MLSFLFSYWSKSKLYLGPLDPLKILAFQEAAWVSTVFFLYFEGSTNEEQLSIFLFCIVLWWLSWWGFSSLFGRNYKRVIFLYFQEIEKIQKKKSIVLMVAFYMASLIFLIGTIKFGGGGDDRLAIMKIFRPLEGFVVLLAPIVLFKLLISRDRIRTPLLVFAAALMIAIGGKGAIFVFLLPITAVGLIGHVNFKILTIIKIAVLLISGVFVSILINYGADSIYGVVEIFFHRLMMEGDIYILALANNGIVDVKITSLFFYVFAPIFKSFMLPFEFDRNIGAQISSALTGFEVQTGPNGHWSVLAMIYGFKADVELLFISFVFYSLIISLKLFLISSGRLKNLPIALTIPLGSYVIQFPQTFFADPPYQFVYLVHVIIVALILSLVFFCISTNNCKRVSRVKI